MLRLAKGLALGLLCEFQVLGMLLNVSICRIQIKVHFLAPRAFVLLCLNFMESSIHILRIDCKQFSKSGSSPSCNILSLVHFGDDVAILEHILCYCFVLVKTVSMHANGHKTRANYVLMN